jgi:hypothetical protein
MSIWEFLFVAIVAILFVSMLVAFCTVNPVGDDAFMCRAIGLVITSVILINYIGAAFITPVAPIDTSKVVIIWNRTGYQHSKAGWQVHEYRKPNSQLPSSEYMMGVELARSNACNHFDFNYDSEIDRFKRCAYFFPEFKTEYETRYQERVGICI